MPYIKNADRRIVAAVGQVVPAIERQAAAWLRPAAGPLGRPEGA